MSEEDVYVLRPNGKYPLTWKGYKVMMNTKWWNYPFHFVRYLKWYIIGEIRYRRHN